MLKFLTLLAAFATLSSAHDFHVSITQMEQNGKTGRLEIAVKIFTDDLELAVQPAGIPKLHLATREEHAAADSLIGQYLLEHLRLHVDGIPVVLAYLGKETESDATWCYLESGPMGKIGQLKVTNTVLFAQFDDQVNIIHWKQDGRTKARMVSASDRSVLF